MCPGAPAISVIGGRLAARSVQLQPTINRRFVARVTSLPEDNECPGVPRRVPRLLMLSVFNDL